MRGLHRGSCHPQKREVKGAFSPPSHTRAISSLTYRPALPKPAGTMWDFHRSVPSAIVSGRHRQTPRKSAGNIRTPSDGKTTPCPSTLQAAGDPGAQSGPKRDTSRTTPAWPLRRHRLPDDPGCLPLRNGEFEQALLYGHGPAQVGLCRLGILRRRHRLRLSRRYLRLTPHAGAWEPGGLPAHP